MDQHWPKLCCKPLWHRLPPPSAPWGCPTGTLNGYHIARPQLGDQQAGQIGGVGMTAAPQMMGQGVKQLIGQGAAGKHQVKTMRQHVIGQIAMHRYRLIAQFPHIAQYQDAAAILTRLASVPTD
jgi:hypothetical protein